MPRDPPRAHRDTPHASPAREQFQTSHGARRQPRAAPADRPAPAAGAAAAAADRCRQFLFRRFRMGRTMELGRSGRAIMRPRVRFANTPIATALTPATRVHLFCRPYARARGAPTERAPPADRPAPAAGATPTQNGRKSDRVNYLIASSRVRARHPAERTAQVAVGDHESSGDVRSLRRYGRVRSLAACFTSIMLSRDAVAEQRMPAGALGSIHS